MPASPYASQLTSLLSTMFATNDAMLDRVAGFLDRSIADGGVVHIFGSGHSAMLAQELFHRAGGLAPINALLDRELSIFAEGSHTANERREGYAAELLGRYDVRPGEVLLIVSTSGINAVPIELAQEARKRALITVAVGSVAAYQEAEPRHSSGWGLFETVDYLLDTCVPWGDGVVRVGEQQVGAVSTVLGAALLNELAVRTCQRLAARGGMLPVFTSQNTPGGDEANEALVLRYGPRIPLMKA